MDKSHGSPLLELLRVSFWAEAELPHLIVTELVQVCVHLRISSQIADAL